MISYKNAQALILSKVSKLKETEDFEILAAVGKKSTANIYAQTTLPPFNKSAMDGYAFSSKDYKKWPLVLKAKSIIAAGDHRRLKINPGTCMKIMTGAPVPEGADTVIPIEQVSAVKEDEIIIEERLDKWSNICFKGEVFNKGDLLLKKGTVIDLGHIGVLAAAGISEIVAGRLPKVAVLNTGNEIKSWSKSLEEGQIYNSNGPMLKALLKNEQVTIIDLGIAKDDKKALKKKIEQGLTADILLVSGGVSMGDFDFVPSMMASMGVEKIFHKIRIKPGKPLFFGLKEKTAVFGLPGNPTSVYLSFLLFVKTALNKMLDKKKMLPTFRTAYMQVDYKIKKSDRIYFLLVKVSREKERLLVKPITTYGSGDLLALAKADGFVEIDSSSKKVLKKEAKVKFISWKAL
jgi:molybdopterin molybdotransferase